MRRKTPTLPYLLAAACTAWAPLSAQAPALDACAVLTREEINKLSGKDPGPPDPSGSGAVTNCHWNQTRPKTVVTLYTTVDPKEPRGLALKQLLDRGRTARAVPGLGDDARPWPRRRFRRCADHPRLRRALHLPHGPRPPCPG